MKLNKNIIASIGAGIEYYDFVIFGHLAGVLSTIFFANKQSTLALIYSYMIFSMAYIVRPLGGLFAGLIADKFGRQKTFVGVIFLMASATFMIGMLPSYHMIGVFAPIMLIICRLAQGLSFGADMPSAITLITENSAPNSRFLNNSLLCSSATLGAILASLVMQLLGARVNELWRLPFLLGGSLAIVGLVLRKLSFVDKEHIANNKSLFTPLKVIYIEYKVNFIAAIIFLLFSAVLVISYIYYATYFSSYFSYTMQNTYQFSMLALVICALLLPVFAKLFAGKNPYLVAAIIALVFSFYHLFLIKSKLLGLHNVMILGGFLIIQQVFVAAFNSVAYTAIAELFPAEIRATSVALVYNLAFMLASFLPLITVSLIGFADQNILLWLLALVSVMSFFAAIWCYLNTQGAYNSIGHLSTIRS